MDEETKLLYSSIELDKFGIKSPPIYSFKNFNDLVNELYKRHDFFEKANLLKYSNNISIDLNINNNITDISVKLKIIIITVIMTIYLTIHIEYNDENDFKDETYINFTGSILVIENYNKTKFLKKKINTHIGLLTAIKLNEKVQYNANFYADDEINNNNIILEYINTEKMLVDPLTKSITVIKMNRFTNLIFTD
ncbi:hypothetical protein H8356DRAFT_1407929 [Neocallimastix lanati (nom. inval.)]|nr:hypothetical protein H8356DRAFT_1407929 [Neocallimastix sp. JGI-2020a]